MRDRRFYKPLLGLAAVLALTCTSAIQTSMNVDRDKLQITRVTPLENAPPALVFTTVALGGFRGIISNFLWMRANRLQQDSKYFEAVQLADWITKLQPHYAQIWRIQAWNMTYNISVKFPDRDDKWNWIMAGVELLRDEGIQYNPHTPVLYEELGYFFYHKMGGTSDLAHQNFKIRWAWIWHNILNVNGLRLIDGGLVEDLPKSGESLAVVLRTSRDVLHIRVFDKDGKMVVDQAEGGFERAEAALEKLRAMLDDLWAAETIPAEKRSMALGAIAAVTRQDFLNGGGFPDYAALVNPQTAAAREVAGIIEKEHKMDVRLMMKVDEDYGPLDWRLPETHAIYWAMEGIRRSKSSKLLPLRRIIYQSMQLASRRGKVIENKFENKLEYSANVNIIPKANASYLEMMQLDPESAQHITQGHRNFLIRAIRDLYLENRRDSALEWFTYAKQQYPDLWYEDSDIDKFVVQNVIEDLNAMNPNDFRNMIEHYITRAYFNLARGENDLYQGNIGLARQVRAKFMYWITYSGVKRIEARSMPTLAEIETGVLKKLFDPASGSPEEFRAILLTAVPNIRERLGLEPESPVEPGADPAANAANPNR